MRRVLVIGCLALLPSLASAQRGFIPDSATNLKVFPKTIPMRALVDTMKSFTFALGVRCEFCHVQKETAPGEQEAFDFAADDKVTKKKARVMLQMVAAINNDHLPKLTERKEPPIAVACMTCHRGVTDPRPLQAVLLTAYSVGGADSAEKVYRALRDRYYGRASYDFGEGTLADVAGAIRAQNKMPDAMRFYILNTQMLPTSAFAWQQAATAQLAAGDTASAVKSLEKAVELNPNDQRVKAMLGRLKK